MILFAIARRASVARVNLTEHGISLWNFKGTEVLDAVWSALEYHVRANGDLLVRAQGTRRHYLIQADFEEFPVVVLSVIRRASEFTPPVHLRTLDSYRMALTLLAALFLVSCFLAGFML
jgi:hypothetical protein